MTKKLLQNKNGSLTKDHGYAPLLEDLQSIIASGQYTAYKTVDNIKVQTYWQLGERIVREELRNQDRADYGENLIECLAVDLKISRRHLYDIVLFYKAFPIMHTVCAQLSWSHLKILSTIENEQERLFYQNKVVQNSWGVRVLRSEIKSDLYHSLSVTDREVVFKTTLPAVEPYEIFKDSYNFNYLGLEERHKEKDLEERIILNLEKTLFEFGEDFAILGRQVPIKIGGQTHHVDLILYHCGIPCKILIDLKVGKFNSRDVGQMNKYVSYYRQNKQYAHEKDTIGLIICREKNHEEVHYALDGLKEKIFVAEYKIKLPSEEQLLKAVENL